MPIASRGPLDLVPPGAFSSLPRSGLSVRFLPAMVLWEAVSQLRVLPQGPLYGGLPRVPTIIGILLFKVIGLPETGQSREVQQGSRDTVALGPGSSRHVDLE